MLIKYFLYILCIMSCITSYGQNKRGYAIDPQLKFLSNFNPPVSKAIAPVASVFMDLMPKKIDKENRAAPTPSWWTTREHSMDTTSISRRT